MTLRQLADADRRLWKTVTEKLGGDLGKDLAGNRLVDGAVREAMLEPAFLTMLLPLPGRAPGERSCRRSSWHWKEASSEGEPEVEGETEGGRDGKG